MKMKKVAMLGVAVLSLGMTGALSSCEDPLGLAGILANGGTQEIHITVDCNCGGGNNNGGNNNGGNNNDNQGNEETKPAELTAVYGSGSFSFMSAYPGYTFKQVTTSVQNIETYDDGTYVLSIVNKNLSGALEFDPSNEGNMDVAGTNDRGQTVTVYYGEYTSTEEEGVISMTLKTPKNGYSLTSGNSTAGSSFSDPKAFENVVVSIDSETHAFDYIALTQKEDTVTKPETIKGVYGSGSFSFMSAFPGYTFKQVTTKVQNLELNTDGTYSMTIANKNLSGALEFDPSNEGNKDVSGTNDRGQSVTVYTGTYTSTEEEGIMSVTLAIPTGGYALTSGNSTAGSSLVKFGEEGFAMLTEANEVSIDVETGAFDFVTLK